MSLNFEKCRFVNLSKTEEQELFCSICLCVFRDPKVTQCCKQTYCAQCIEPWVREHKTCPNDRSDLNDTDLLPAPRIVTNIINQLNVSCDYRDNGCNEIVLLESLAKHVECCAYNPEGICEVCLVKYGEKASHKCYENLMLKIKSLEIKNDEMCDKYQVLEAINRSLNEENIKLTQEIQHKFHEIKRLTDLSEKATQHITVMKNKILSIFEDNQISEVKVNKPISKQLNSSAQELSTIRLKIGKFITNTRQNSIPIMVRDKPWRILAQNKINSDLTKCFGFYLLCDDKGATQWSFTVNVEFRIISQKVGCRDFCRKLKNVYTNKENDWGLCPFLDWNTIIDESNGYLIGDAIILEVAFTIDD